MFEMGVNVGKGSGGMIDHVIEQQHTVLKCHYL
jgi:hypothetical protein